jgi:signal transduction histidine kinase
VAVSLEWDGSMAEIVVSDTGEGISAEFLPDVFGLFTQAESARERRGGGLGLGLAITRELVTLHGGTVAAESSGEGLGSTFRVRLPVLGPPGAPAAEAQTVGRPADGL